MTFRMRNTTVPLIESEPKSSSFKNKSLSDEDFFNLESGKLPENTITYKFQTTGIEEFITVATPEPKPVEDYLKEYQNYLLGNKEVIKKEEIIFDEVSKKWKLTE